MYISGKLLPCARIENGDRMGVYMEEAPGAVAYTFDDSHPTALGHSLDDTNRPTEIGEVVRFDQLTFPYDFSVAAYIDTGLCLSRFTGGSKAPGPLTPGSAPGSAEKSRCCGTLVQSRVLASVRTTLSVHPEHCTEQNGCTRNQPKIRLLHSAKFNPAKFAENVKRTWHTPCSVPDKNTHLRCKVFASAHVREILTIWGIVLSARNKARFEVSGCSSAQGTRGQRRDSHTCPDFRLHAPNRPGALLERIQGPGQTGPNLVSGVLELKDL